MKIFFCMALSFIFSHEGLAVTLGEIGAAAGIAGAIKGTAEMQPKKETLEKVKEVVQEYEQAQQKQIANFEGVDESQVTPSEESEGTAVASSLNDAEKKSSSITKESSDESESEERQRERRRRRNLKNVNYEKPVHIFYKRKCLPRQRNCNRGPVLTNIKSIIFDYDRSRGSFAKSETNKPE